MCGLLALMSRDRLIEPSSLLRGTSLLRHRGPDTERIWLSADRSIGLGHTRLSIIDLVTGTQPLSNEDGSCHLIANGEFYEFEQLRADLISRRHTFKSQSDSEVALHLYEEMGPECLSQLRGEFAFIIWDSRRRQLFAARDRFGVKPLFYVVGEDALYIGSEIKALFAAGVQPAWDTDGVIQQLFFCLPGDRTIFAKVRQVPPGHYLIATETEVRVVPYWDLDYPCRTIEVDGRGEREWITEVRRGLETAVRLRLRADVPVGCFLSGGIDSAAVLALAARHSSRSIDAFCVSFDNEAYDEEPVARVTAARAGATFHSIRLSRDELADHLDQAIWHAETFGDNTRGVARFLLSRKVHNAGYKAVLSGEGADEMFGGYLYFRHDYLRHQRAELDEETRIGLLASLGRDHPAFAKALAAESALEPGAVDGRLGFVPSWLGAMVVSRGPLRSLLSPAAKAVFNRYNREVEFLEGFDIAAQVEDRDPLHQSLYLWIRSMLPNQILVADRMEMAHGLENRLPFLDHHIAECARAIPLPLLIRGNTEKYVLREAVRPFVPHQVYRRPKHPFTAPPATLDSNNRLASLVQDTLRSSLLHSLPIFERASVIALLDRLPTLGYRERIAYDPVIMLLVSTCLLQRHFNPSWLL